MFYISLLSYKIQDIIGDFLDLKTKCRIESINTCSNGSNLKYLTHIKSINNKQSKNLTDKILRKTQFSMLTELEINSESQISDILCLSFLRKLNLYEYCKITKIENIFLEHLNISYNQKTISCNNLKYLKSLNICGYYCGIGELQIIQCINLESLNISHNIKIKNLNYFTNLKQLIIGYCNIDNDDIKKCILIEELRILGTTKITDLNFLTELKILEVGHTKLNNDSIKNCINLEQIKIVDENITKFNHFINLKILDVGYFNNVFDYDIKKCVNLQILNVANNINIKDIGYFKYLKILDISNNCCIDNISFEKIISPIEQLNLENNGEITNVNHLWETLKILNIRCNNVMTTKGFENCIFIEDLNISNNIIITNIEFLSNLKKLNISGIYSIFDNINLKNINPNILELIAFNNKNIINVNHLVMLQVLNIGGNQSKMTKGGFENCINIKKLEIFDNKNIKNNYYSEIVDKDYK